MIQQNKSLASKCDTLKLESEEQQATISDLKRENDQLSHLIAAVISALSQVFLLY